MRPFAFWRRIICQNKISAATATLTLTALFITPQPAEARFDTRALGADKTTNPTAYDSGMKAMVKAADALAAPAHNRAKIPAGWSYNLEGNYKIVSINDETLSPYMTSPESSTHAFGFKVGAGLPYGFAISAGMNRAFSNNYLYGLHVVASYQLFDFSTLLYSEMVPAVAIHLLASRAVGSPGLYAFGGTLSLGAYNRSWPLQFSYGFSPRYTIFLPVSPVETQWTFTHQASMQVPLWWKIYARMELGYPEFQGNLGFGAEF